ncbi:hypothetical protein M6B38_329825 [Iris pallida]|uniref:Uncharacterized protein n=1 Tax=Iris pallida TaxID=29817 RepID=A0AAX6H4D0_IRIPA|nr:hypothetical protein M6B38_178460 [Iris pallida]KAJ6835826.1 hypothetical protein M6B38_329825 [Iris pallida]
MFSAASSALLEIPRSELPILLNPHAKLPLLSFGNRIGLSFLSSPPASSACSSALPSTEPSTSERRSSWNLWHLWIEFLRIKLSLPNTKRGKTSEN